MTPTRTHLPRQRTADQPPQRHPTDEIIDHAAGLFARHGLADTSMEQIEFAVPLSKMGLLHQFASKQTLLEAAIEISRRHVEEILARVADLPHGRERDLAVVESTVGFSFAWPGVSALRQSMVASQVPHAELERQGFALLPALDLDPVDIDPVRMANVLYAFAGLNVASQQFLGEHRAHEWRELLVAATMRTLGHFGTCPDETSTPTGAATDLTRRRVS